MGEQLKSFKWQCLITLSYWPFKPRLSFALSFLIMNNNYFPKVYSLKSCIFSLCVLYVLSSCAVNPTGGIDFVTMRKAEKLNLALRCTSKFFRKVLFMRIRLYRNMWNEVGQSLRPSLTDLTLSIHLPSLIAQTSMLLPLPGGFLYISIVA